MRDLETVSLALTAAETGHLVFGTLHTSGAPLVCNVPKTKCPVSAAVNAKLTVSKSLISPTKITSGSSLNAAFSAAAKD